MTRRARLLASLAAILVAGGVAAVLVLAFGNSSSQAAPTKAVYFRRVAKICGVYGPKLDQVTPPQDVTIPGEVVTSLSRAIPIIEAGTAAAYIHFEQLARQTSRAGHEVGFPSICSSAS